MMPSLPQFEIRSEKMLLSSDAVQPLGPFCLVLEGMQNEKTAVDIPSLKIGLAALAAIFNTRPDSASETPWDATFYPSLSGNGGTLQLKEKNGNQTLVISRDRKGALYNGVWSRLDDSHASVCVFDIESSSSGYQLKLSMAEGETRIPLGESLSGFQWADLMDVLAFLPPWLNAGVKSLVGAARAPLPPQPPPPQPGTAEPVLKNQPLPSSALHLVIQPGGQNIALTGSLSIGRGQDNALRLNDEKLSRHHAVIEAVPYGWQVRDLGSTNGIKVNGKRISAASALKAGDVIEMGDSRLKLE
jgi:hypothetical protein